MLATLSILGLYNYNSTIFDGLDVPEGLEKNILVDYIFMECADLELLYPNWDIMKRLITSWSDARVLSWGKLYESTRQQFNMIHNYDRYEEWTDTGSGTTSSTGTSTTSKAAYNDAAMATSDAVHSTASGNAANTGSHSGHLYGNIGVTTAAQMLEGVRDLYRWDVYQAIANEFKQRFCIMVY